MVCPADTPEGESCGLDKNLALTAHVTSDADTAPVQALALALGVQPTAVLSAAQLHAKCAAESRGGSATGDCADEMHHASDDMHSLPWGRVSGRGAEAALMLAFDSSVVTGACLHPRRRMRLTGL